jgi:hypothetical protein
MIKCSMKISIILLAIVYFLTSGKTTVAKSRAVFNAERREIISDEGEPTYYKLFSDAELTSAKFREVKKIFLKTISQHNN